MVTADGSKTLCQTVAHNHVDTYCMNELLHLRIHRCTCSGEEVRILQSEFLANQREHRLVQHLILQMQTQRRTLALREIVDIMALSDAQSMLEKFTLGCIGLLDLLLNTHEHFLPETRYTRHTSGMSLTHRLLHLQRIGIDYQSRSFCQTKDLPSFLKDMGKGQEIQHTVTLSHGHTLIIGLHGSMILSTSQDNALRIARSTTGIENIGNVIHRCLSLQFLHLRLSGQIISQFQEILKIHGIGIVSRDTNILIEDDDTLQGVTGCKNATRLVVLLLFTHEQESDLGVVHHKLNLLLRTGSIEWNGHCTDAPCAEVTEHILHRIL